MSTLYSIPGIINVLDAPYNMTPSDLTGTTNASGLLNALGAAGAIANGAMIIIPTVDANGISGPYKLSGGAGAIASITNGQPVLICGTGGGTTLEVVSNSAALFSITNTPLTFQDLTIIFSQTGSFLAGTAFSLNNGMNYNLFRVTIQDCAKPVLFNNLTQGYMCESSILYTNAFPANALIGISLTSAAEVWIDKCVLSFSSTHFATSQVGISVGQSSWTRITQCEVQNFYNGIQLGIGMVGTTKGTMITNSHVVTAAGGVGVQIKQSVYDVKMIGCRFENVTAGTAQNVVIMATSNDEVDTVLLDSCVSTGSIDYGVQIDAGQIIQILGGTYSGNITAGIAVTGSAAEIQIDGVNCLGLGNAGTLGPQVYGIYVLAGSDIQITNANCSGNGTSAQHGSGIFVQAASGLQIGAATCQASSPSYQDNGIVVQAATDIVIKGCSVSGSLLYGINLISVTNVTVLACDLYGNATAGVSVAGPGAALSQRVYIRNCNITGYSMTSTILFSGSLMNVAVTNCAGYNDRATPVHMTPPGSGTFSGVTYGYYGPTAFYVAGSGLGVTIDGTLTGLGQGSYSLGIGETAAISGSPTTFYMFGR